MKETKTVLLVAPYFPPHSGGLERYAFEIARRLCDNFHWRIVVVTSGRRFGNDEKEEMDGLCIYRLSYFFKFSNTPFCLGWFLKIRKIIQDENPDIINIHAPVPGIGDIASMLSGKKPVIVTYHSGSMRKGSFFLDMLIFLYEKTVLRLMLSRADYIICSSDFVRFNFLRGYYYKSRTITPGVNSGSFLPPPGSKANRPTLIFVAGLGVAEQHKGLKTLINALEIARKKIPDINLLIVGEGDMKSQYEDYVSRNKLDKSVSFCGKLDGDLLVKAYQQAHVFVLPSSNDNHPMVILEAMSCGLPVVSTLIGEIPSIVEDGKTGFLIKPHNAKMVAEKILELINDPIQAVEMGANGREKAAENFDWNIRAANYNEIFEKTLKMNSAKIPKLIVIAPYFYPKVGGAENYSYNIARRFHESGEYKVSLITGNYKKRGYIKETIDGITVHRLPVWWKISNTLINPMWYWWFKRIFAEEEPDIINIHSPVVFMADIAVLAAKKNLPIILTYHSGSMRKGRWPIDVIIYLYEKIFLQMLFARVDMIIAVSQNFFQNNLGKRYSYKAHLVRPGVDNSQFRPSPLPVDSQTITFVGRIDRGSSWKGVEQLLLAMAMVVKKFPDARLEIVGSGDMVGYYRMRAEKLGIGSHVFMRGALSGEGLIGAYRRSNVVVLSSTSEAEQSSIVLVEAMACGRPTVGTKIGGTPHIITNEENGLLVPPNDPEALAEAIGKVLSNETFAKKLADGGALSAKKVDWNVQIEKHRELFQKLSDIKAKPNIAQVVGLYPPHLGGMERVAQMISEKIAERNYRVIVLTSDIGMKKNASKQDGNLSVRALKGFEFAHTPFVPALLWHLLQLPKNTVIHFHFAQAYFPENVLLISKLRGMPYVIHFHLDVEPSGVLGPLFVIYKKLTWGHVLRSAKKVIVSTDNQSQLVQKKFKVKKENIAIIPNGVGDDFFSHSEYKLPDGYFRLLYIGRLAVQKRVDRLLEAMAMIKIPARLTIVGDGEDRRKLEALADRLGLRNISFEGMKNDKEMQEYHRNHDALLMSSDREGGTPLVLLEAMAAGLPIIGSNVSGIKDTLKDVGVLVDEPYAENFAKVIEELWACPEKLRILANQSRKKAKQYSWEKIIDQMEILYKEL